MRTRAVEIREYEAGDERAILSAFNRVNAVVDPNFTPRSLKEWRWRFDANPAGRRVMLALDEEGAVLAQYAGLPQLAHVGGETRNLTQGIDSFSVPSTRALGRASTFVETGEQFAARFGGRGRTSDVWMWGFPIPSARHVGQRFLGYELLRSQPLCELDKARIAPRTQGVLSIGWSELGEWSDALTQLEQRHAQTHGACAARGATELAWRYGSHPRYEYELALVPRSDGSLAGFGVYRAGRFQGRRLGLLCDGLFDAESTAAIVRWAANHAWRDAVEALVTMLPPWCASFAELQELGFRVRSNPLLLVGRSYDRSLPVRFWTERWYYTLGDTDLV